MRYVAPIVHALRRRSAVVLLSLAAAVPAPALAQDGLPAAESNPPDEAGADDMPRNLPQTDHGTDRLASCNDMTVQHAIIRNAQPSDLPLPGTTTRAGSSVADDASFAATACVWTS